MFVRFNRVIGMNPGYEFQRSACGHGLQCVAHQIEEHLLQLIFISLHLRQAGVVILNEPDVRMPILFFQQQDFLQYLVDVEQFEFQLRGPGEIQHALHHAVDPIRFFDHHVQKFMMLVRQTLAQ